MEVRGIVEFSSFENLFFVDYYSAGPKRGKTRLNIKDLDRIHDHEIRGIDFEAFSIEKTVTIRGSRWIGKWARW